MESVECGDLLFYKIGVIMTEVQRYINIYQDVWFQLCFSYSAQMVLYYLNQYQKEMIYIYHINKERSDSEIASLIIKKIEEYIRPD